MTQGDRLMRLVLMTFLCLLFSDIGEAEEKFVVGTLAPRSIVGHFVSGPLVAQQTEICPTLWERDECKIAVFTRGTKEIQQELVASVNDLVRADTRLQWSFWMVSHENDPTPDDVPWEQMLSELTEFSRSRKVTALSAGVLIRIPDTSKNTRAQKSVGVFSDQFDTVVMFIVPDASKHFGKIEYVKRFKSAELNAETIAEVQKELKVVGQTAFALEREATK